MVMPKPSAGHFYGLFYNWISSTCQHEGKLVKPALARVRTVSTGRNRPTSSDILQISSNEHSDYPLPEQMRRVMQRIAHPVVVITAHAPSESSDINKIPKVEAVRAMTVSSFNTVCLNPTPIISLNIKTPSSTWAAIQASDGRFVAHFLHASKQGVQLAHAFAQGIPPASIDLSEAWFAPDVEMDLKSKSKAPMFPGFQGRSIIAAVKCRLLPDKHISVGDHLLICAEVMDVVFAGGWTAAGLGLSYAAQRFRIAGSPVADAHGEPMED